MSRRGASRGFGVIGAIATAAAVGVFALGGVASAHVVTSINVDCYQTSVHFSGFPQAGVTVHIAVDVSGQPPIASDVVVTSATTQAQVDITPATDALFGATANVDVDVTWTFEGPQHVHQTLTVTCGSPTTTTTAPPTTTTAAPTTTTAAPTPTTAAPTTTVPETTTSLAVMGSTTIVTPTTAPETTTSEAVAPLGSTLPPTTTTQPAVVTLPRTGSDPAFPLVFGVSSILGGALLVLRARRMASH